MFLKKAFHVKKCIAAGILFLGVMMSSACGQEQENREMEVVTSDDISQEYHTTEKSESGEEESVSKEESASKEESVSQEKIPQSSELKKMFGENCIEEQTFEVELSQYGGKVYFVPFAPTEDNPELIIQIIQEGKVLDEIQPGIPEALTGEEFTCLDAVSFYDVNYDDSTDIVLILTYGDTSFASFHFNYGPSRYGHDSYYYGQEVFSEEITEELDTLTIPEIRKLLSNGKKNGEFTSYQEAYISVSNLCEWNAISDLEYDLIYFDDDEIPELVVAHNGYYTSLYTYHDGKVYMLMDEWGYGAGGNMGYEYVPKKNSLRNYDTDGAGAILHTTYAAISNQYSMDIVAEIMTVNFDDVNKNGRVDENEQDSLGNYGVIYLNGVEATAEECMAYDMGEYENIRGVMTRKELEQKLNQ